MNNNNSILLIDPAFEPATAKSCNLVIKVGLDNFSYAIINHETKKVSAVFDEQECEDGATKLAERLKTDPYLKLPYREVKVALSPTNTIAIPNTLFNEDSLTTHAQYFTAVENKNVYTQIEENFGFTTLFSIASSTQEILENELQGSIKYQELAGLLSMLAQIEESTLVFDFTVGTFNVIYLNHKTIQFQQSYEIDHIEEFNYYLLLIIKQLIIYPILTKLQILSEWYCSSQGDDKYNC
jgi:hypothetical protein